MSRDFLPPKARYIQALEKQRQERRMSGNEAGRRPTALGIPSPWSGDENDPIPWTYHLWYRLYHVTRQLRHRLRLHDWSLSPVAQKNKCSWCGEWQR